MDRGAACFRVDLCCAARVGGAWQRGEQGLHSTCPKRQPRLDNAVPIVSQVHLSHIARRACTILVAHYNQEQPDAQGSQTSPPLGLLVSQPHTHLPSIDRSLFFTRVV